MKKLRVKLVKSPIGYARDQKATLRALKLTRLGRVREFPDNPAIRGMVRKVQHLVAVEEVEA